MRTMAPFGILADDLTGACDCGVAFSARGARVRVLQGAEEPTDVETPPAEGAWGVTVVNTESRQLPSREATRTVERWVARLEAAGWPVRYKKIDSTLRGNLVAELVPLLAAPEVFLLVAPAFPATGRTVEGGVLRVGGTPVHETEIGRDRLTPVRESHLPTLLGDGLSVPVAHLPRAAFAVGPEGADALLRQLDALIARGARVIVPDTAGMEDLSRLAGALLPAFRQNAPPAARRPIVVGSGGMAHALAGGLLPEARPAPLPPRATGKQAAGPVLVVAGSRTEVTRRQVAYLAARPDVFHARIDPAAWEGREGGPDREGRTDREAGDPPRAWGVELAASLAAAGESGAAVLLVSIAPGAGEHEAPARFLARSRRLNRALGSLVARLLRERPPAGLVLTGGDIARAVLEALRVRALQLGAEVLPGIPLGWAVDGEAPGLPLVTKAGGFGAPEALAQAAAAIRGAMASRTAAAPRAEGA